MFCDTVVTNLTIGFSKHVSHHSNAKSFNFEAEYQKLLKEQHSNWFEIEADNYARNEVSK